MRGWQRWAGTIAAMSLMSGVIGACVGDQGTGAPQPPDHPADPVDAPGIIPGPDGDDAVGIDWSVAFSITLDNGWMIEPCEGDAPLACVRDGDRHVGVIELGHYAVDPDRASVDGLRVHAEEFLTGMRDDRAIGCPAHAFVADAPQEVQVAGGPGIRVDFRMDDGTTTVERNLLYWTIRGQTQWVMTAAASAPDGCLEPIGEFHPDDLAEIANELDRVIALTVLPAPDLMDNAVTDGTVIEVDDGRIFFVWEGRKQRIQQPAALTEADLDALGLTVSADAPRHLTVGEEGTRFVLYPADGPESQLYLEEDRVLYAIDVVTVSAEVVDALVDLDELVITRARLP